LYKSIGGQKDQEEFQMSLLWVLNYSDGNYSLLDIAEKSGIDFKMIQKAEAELVKCDLLKEQV
jgi:aminopeptidase-like protein